MRLTLSEIDLLIAAAEFALAGEWPWGSGDDARDRRDSAVLRRASEKLKDRRDRHESARKSA